MADRRIGDRLIPTLVAGFLLAMMAVSRGATLETFELAWAFPFGVLFVYLLIGFEGFMAILGLLLELLIGLIGLIGGIAGSSLGLLKDVNIQDLPFRPRVVDQQPTVEIYAREHDYTNN